MKQFILFLGLVVASAAGASTGGVSKDALVNIKPVGQVRIADGDNVQPMLVDQPKAAVGAKEAKPLTVAELGEQIYQTRCSACHGSGIAGAPKLGDKAAWQPRIDKGYETLVSHAIQGFNAMPQKGTCMTCSDEDIQAAVKFMVASCQ